MSIPISELLNNPPKLQHHWLDDLTCVCAVSEYGRYYHSNEPDSYPFPCDEPERNRCDSLHHIVYAHLLSKSTDPTTERYVVGDHVPDAPIATSPVLELDPVRVIDLGCGTGGWSCDMALLFPAAQIEAVDISAMQPQRSAGWTNLRWHTPGSSSGKWFDINDSVWPAFFHSYDLVHASQLCGAISNWHAFVDNCFRVTCPGGIFESIEFDYEPLCYDDSVDPDSGIFRWWALMQEATKNKSLEYPYTLPTILRDAGFEDVQCLTLPVPFGEWSEDIDVIPWIAKHRKTLSGLNGCDTLVLPVEWKLHWILLKQLWTDRLRAAGIWMRDVFIDSCDPAAECRGFEGLSLAALIRQLKWTEGEAQAFLRRLRSQLPNHDKSSRLYFRLHVLVARKP